MAFKSKKALNGEIDKNINAAGRPPKGEEKKQTNRSRKDQEMLGLLRKFKPHLAKAVNAAVNVLDNEVSTDQNKLKAGAYITQTYINLLNEVYNEGNEGGDDLEINPKSNAPVFSLRMINNDEGENKQE